MSIFKAYDIRGTIPDQLNEDVIARIATAFVAFLKKENPNKLTLVVGRDNRASSETFSKTCIATLQKNGVDVVDAGLTSTPYFYYAVAARNRDGGIMITASHNPPQYNGCKLVSSHAKAIGIDSGLKEIEALFESSARDQDARPQGDVSAEDLLEEYVQDNITLALNTEDLKSLHAVVDTGNGVSALMCEALFKKIPARFTRLFFELDGTFPNHMPNPLEEKNTADLRREVVATKADLGIALDADGDRVIFIDEEGKTISSDLITALVAKELLTKNPGATILYDIRSSWITKETIEHAGGKAGVTKVGHAFIKNQMRDANALFAGELSGHFYYRFGDYGFFEAPLAVIMTLMTVIAREKKSLSEILKPFRAYYATGEINFEVEDKEKALARIEDAFTSADRIDKLDGITLEYKDWWCNVRPSNTENLLRLNLEAKTEELRDEKSEEIKKLIEL